MYYKIENQKKGNFLPNREKRPKKGSFFSQGGSKKGCFPLQCETGEVFLRKGEERPKKGLYFSQNKII